MTVICRRAEKPAYTTPSPYTYVWICGSGIRYNGIGNHPLGTLYVVLFAANNSHFLSHFHFSLSTNRFTTRHAVIGNVFISAFLLDLRE